MFPLSDKAAPQYTYLYHAEELGMCVGGEQKIIFWQAAISELQCSFFEKLTCIFLV